MFVVANEKIRVADHLSDGEYKLFISIHSRHSQAMGEEEKAKHTLSHITKIARNIEENCFEVYYQNGNWWHYYTDGTWS